jgi:hypothetical protein
MNPENIKLSNINKSFEYEKISRDIDSIDDLKTLKNLAKAYIKLYLQQQEIICNLGQL